MYSTSPDCFGYGRLRCSTKKGIVSPEGFSASCCNSEITPTEG